jgi:transglutaminase-like putative cysteine protease
MESGDPFLRSTDVIDWHHPAVAGRARELAAGLTDPAAIAARCYAFVRDEIRHTADDGSSVVTCAASEVLQHGSGYCYAKSHLLAALLRANGVPAGLCYQRVSLDEDGTRFCLHGLNAVLLPDVGWFRVDARGNKNGIEAEFSPPVECLAFSIGLPGEADLPEVFADPLPVVVEALRRHRTAAELGENLPDLPLWL